MVLSAILAELPQTTSPYEVPTPPMNGSPSEFGTPKCGDGRQAEAGVTRNTNMRADLIGREKASLLPGFAPAMSLGLQCSTSRTSE